jgi:ABC-type amino acid transport substrate-binding protein
MNNKLSVFSLIVAVCALGLILFRPALQTVPHKETAYDRVVRTMTLRCGWMMVPPFIAADPNSRALSGLNYNYIETMAKLLGLKITWQEILNGQQIEVLRTNKVDAICGAEAPIIAAMSVYLHYTEPYAFFPINMFVREGDTRFDGDFKKAIDKANDPKITVAFLDGDTSQDFALQMYPKAKRHEVPSTVDMAQIYMDIVLGKADFVIEENFSSSDFMKNNPGKLRQVKLDKPFAVIPVQTSVLRGEEALADLLDQGVALMRQRGFEDAILSKYEREYPGSFYRVRKEYDRSAATAP